MTRLTVSNIIDTLLKPIDKVSDTLERKLGLFSVVIISLSAMLGSGLFVLPALAMLEMGGDTVPVGGIWIAYLLAAIVVLPGAISKAELATAMPSSGGSYVYVERTFGPMFGTIAGLGLWANFMLKSAFALIGFKAYLWVLEEIIGISINIEIAAMVLLLLIVVINILGVKRIKKVQAPIVLIAITFLFAISIYATLTMEMNWEAVSSKEAFGSGWKAIATTSAFVFVSYAGVTKIAAVGGEIKNPSRNIPYGILLSLLISCTLYVFITLIMAATVDPSGFMKGDGHAREDPIYIFVTAVGGSNMGIIAALLAVLTMTSMALAGIMASSRFPFAMARDNLLPEALENVHPKFQTPYIAIIGTGLAMALAIIFLPVHDVAELASGFKIMIFIVINASVIVLRRSAKSHSWYNPEWKSPLYPFTQIMGIISGIILLILMGSKSFIGAGVAVVLGIAIYKTYGQKHANPEITPWDTFKMMISEPDKVEKMRLHEAFEAADKDNNKSINLKEFTKAIGGLGLKSDEHAAIRMYFHEADANNDGAIDVDEFCDFIGIISEAE